MVRHEELVDQVVFRWDADNLSGTTGFGPVAWSVGPEEADGFFHALGPLLRATGEAGAPGLVRLERRGKAVLLRRIPWRDPGGRASTVCHALMGTAQSLDAETCVGLHTWSWARDVLVEEVRGPLDKVRPSVLLTSALAGQSALTEGLPAAAETLTASVAELLLHPEHRMSVLDTRGGSGAYVTLWGLFGMFGTVLPGRWTFATHDTAESPETRFAFVRRWPDSSSQDARRIRLDPGDRPAGRAGELAALLVDHHLRRVGRQGEREYEVFRALADAAERRGPGVAAGSTWLDVAEYALSALAPTGRPSDRMPAQREPAAPARTEPPRQGPPRPEWSRGEALLGEPPRGEGTWPEAARAEASWGEEPRADRYRTEWERGEEQRGEWERGEEQRGEWGRGEEQRGGQLRGERSRGEASRDGTRRFEASRGETAPAAGTPRGRYAAHESAGWPAARAIGVVDPEWPAPRDSEPHRRLLGLARRGRRASQPYPDVLAELRSLYGDYETEPSRARAVVATLGDGDLARALCEDDLPYAAVTLLVEEAADRWPGWSNDTRLELCDAVLRMGLFYRRRSGAGRAVYPTAEVRCANAASLYRWAVRPFAGDPRVSDRIEKLLPGLSTGPDPVGREVVRQILETRLPGLREEVWRALWRAAYEQRGQPQEDPEPEHVPVRPRSQPSSSSSPPPPPPRAQAPRRRPLPRQHPPPQPLSQQPPDARRLFFAAVALLTALVVALVVVVVVAI